LLTFLGFPLAKMASADNFSETEEYQHTIDDKPETGSIDLF